MVVGVGLPVLALAAGLPGAAAGASDASGLYPAADCAALWMGYGDYARRSAYLGGAEDAYDKAELFRAAAIRQTGDKTLVDTHIGVARAGMELMIEALIMIGDAQSRDLFERFSQTCEDFSADLPEFQDS